MTLSLRTLFLAGAAIALAVHPGQAAAQGGVALTGRLLSSVSGEPIPRATVRLDELRRETLSADDGTFAFDNVPPGTYHVSVFAQGFSSRRTEVVAAAAAGPPVKVTVDPELHFQEVVSVSTSSRSQFEAFQPTSVLAGQELAKELEMSLGAALENQPGVAARSFGPAPSRPVVRGLDGDRVLILQDGQRMGDLSSQSGDHGVTINPAAAERIEVVRGPATLLYGTNAIGGLVNIITDDIPTRRIDRVQGNVIVDSGTAANEAAAAASVEAGRGAFALKASGGGRRSGDVATPEGDVLNSQSRSGFGTIGLGWAGERGYAGASYGYDDTKYGIPAVEGGILQLTPRRHSISVRGGARNLAGTLDELRGTLTVRRYQHDELEGDEVGTAFTNNTTELEAMGSHRAVGRLKGSVGAWFLDRAFDARGEEALSPAVDQRGFAAFVYEELTWPHVTFQFGGRVDTNRFTPAGEPERQFTNASGSMGLLFRPAAANDRLTIAASLARTARSPSLEEMFFFGLHHGNFTIELGNPALESEKALGADLSLRWRGTRASGEITYFRNDIDRFIFRNVLGHEEFEAREAEFEARFPGRELVGQGGEEEELSIVDFVGADTVLQGVELHADVQLAPRLFGEVGADYVRGTVKSTHDPLPRMPPFRWRGGVRYQHAALQGGFQLSGAADQQRVSGAEQPTDGYTLLKLFASYSFLSGTAVNTITARLDNATDTLYRNHLSLIKHLVPEMGRNFKLLYSVKF